MDLITKLRYQGYAATPPLWTNTIVSQFKQIELVLKPQNLDGFIVFKNQRLGKLVEEFVFNQLQQQDDVLWVWDNLQIQDGKQTVGEIDALYYYEDQPIHLEIVYKFYLYDTLQSYIEPLSYWIGPNRKDSFLHKLDKLETKQFPLLYNELTKPYLEIYNLNIKTITQKVCFKAQLFLPYNNKTIDISPLNFDCIAGYYISFSKIELFINFEFYIPKKLDWLVVPHSNVDWMHYSSSLIILERELNNQRSPMVWLKNSESQISKSFIIWW
jgi:hypothetical protein